MSATETAAPSDDRARGDDPETIDLRDTFNPAQATPIVRILPVASARKTRQAVRQLARPHRRLVLVTAAVLVTATFSSSAIPLLLGRIVDVVVDRQALGTLDWLVTGLIVATLVQGVFAGLGSLTVGRLGETLLATLREDVVNRALAVSLDDIERTGTGDLIGRVCGDVDAVSEATRTAIPESVAAALMIALTIIGLATLDWRLAFAGLLALPIQVLATRWYLRRSRPIYATERAAEGARAQQLHASVTGVRTVRAFRLQRMHLAQLTARSDAAVGYSLQAASLRARFFSGLNVAELVGLSAVLAMGFPLVANNTITIGQATAGALFFYRLFDPVGALLFHLDTAQSATAALARLVGVSSLELSAATANGNAVTPTDASVELVDVHFDYGNTDPGGDEVNNEVLHGVDLRLAPGERVALVGTSGAGKSTIAKLVAGIHHPTSGLVRIGGVDLATVAPPEVARLVTLVTQEVHVFAGTLAADLRLGRAAASDDELLAALARVGALEWAEALPHGLDTVVGDGGHLLGPTEAQQLALARLLLADPAVAILDEATAEAGSAGARVLEEAASAAIEGRTALIVAHRLTQAMAADRIIVLDGGRVLESGTHGELVAAGGTYADLWSAWSVGRS